MGNEEIIPMTESEIENEEAYAKIDKILVTPLRGSEIIDIKIVLGKLIQQARAEGCSDLETAQHHSYEAGRQSAVLCPDCNCAMELKEKVLMGDKCRSWTCNECEVSFHLVSDAVWDDIYNGYHFMKKELKNNILTKKAYGTAVIEQQKEIDNLKSELRCKLDVIRGYTLEVEKLKAEKHEQVRKLKEEIKRTLKTLENNLTGFDNMYLKGAIDGVCDIQTQVIKIFPYCAEKKIKGE